MSSKSLVDIREFITANKEISKFFKEYANIQEDSLVTKTFDVYTKALEVHHYRCLSTLKFLLPRITSSPYYDEIKNQSANKKILDIGCALGTDLRKMSLDGIPQNYLYGLDIEKGFVNLGYDLFNDKKTNKMTFIIGNILDKDFIQRMNLPTNFDIVYSSSVIHLLDNEQVKQFLSNIYTILRENGIFFGQTTGLPEPQEIQEASGRHYFLHSGDSLKEELKKIGLKVIKIQVKKRESYSEKEKIRHYSNRDTIFFKCQK